MAGQGAPPATDPERLPRTTGIQAQGIAVSIATGKASITQSCVSANSINPHAQQVRGGQRRLIATALQMQGMLLQGKCPMGASPGSEQIRLKHQVRLIHLEFPGAGFLTGQ
jgi:hypothetical protein